MKKLLLLAALVLAFVATPVKAQWNDNDSCNQNLRGGFANANGSGPGGTFNTRFYVNAHYKVVDIEQVKSAIVGYSIAEMNDYAAKSNYTVRFNGADWSASGNDEGTAKLNFTIYFDVYHNSDDTYTVFVCFHGWGQNHLFRTRSVGTFANSGDALASALHETVDRVNNGWVCNN